MFTDQWPLSKVFCTIIQHLKTQICLEKWFRLCFLYGQVDQYNYWRFIVVCHVYEKAIGQFARVLVNKDTQASGSDERGRICWI